MLVPQRFKKNMLYLEHLAALGLAPMVIKTSGNLEADPDFNKDFLGAVNPRAQQTPQAPGKLKELF